jgi:hypothetical protein
MITETFKDIITRVLGVQYSNKIINHLEEKGIRNSDGRPFSNESIRLFVNGYRDNREVESAIVELVEKESQAAKQLSERIERVVESEKSA